MHRPKIDRVSTGTLTCSRQPKPCASAQLQPPELAREVQRPSTLRGAAGSGGLVADMRCFPFRVVWSRHVWSYPTFPPPIQSELFDTDSESDPAQSQQTPGASQPPSPRARVGMRAHESPSVVTPAGVFFSRFHADRLVIRLKSMDGQNDASAAACVLPTAFLRR